MSTLPKGIIQLINNLDEDQLHALFGLVRDRLKLLHKTKALYAMKEFQVMDKVYFNYHGEKIVGTCDAFESKDNHHST